MGYRGFQAIKLLALLGYCGYEAVGLHGCIQRSVSPKHDIFTWNKKHQNLINHEKPTNHQPGNDEDSSNKCFFNIPHHPLAIRLAKTCYEHFGIFDQSIFSSYSFPTVALITNWKSRTPIDNFQFSCSYVAIGPTESIFLSFLL